MTDPRLRELFHDLAEPVPAPAPASQSPADLWRRAVRRRRRRRIGAAALTAAVAASVFAVVETGTGRQDPPSATSPTGIATVPPMTNGTRIGGIRVDVAPRPDGEARLPRLVTSLPDLQAMGVPKSLPLSQAPVPKALALIQPPGDMVYVLDPGLRLRFIDTVRLADVKDEGGNVQPALDDSSLSPDGGRAAFAQGDAIVVVDLATGEHTRVSGKGFFENVRWRADGTGLIAEQAKAALFIDLTAPGDPRLLPMDGDFGWAAETGPGAGRDSVRLSASPYSGRLTLVRQRPGGPAAPRALPEADEVVSEWFGGGWRTGDLIARSGYSARDGEVWGDGGSGEAVVVLDAGTGEVVRALLFPYEGPEPHGRVKGCCPVLGWFDAATVLLLSRSPQTVRLLAWDIRDGSLRLVSGLPPDTALAFGDLRPR